MPLGIGTGIGMSIAIVSRAVGRARFALDESAFIPGIDPMPGIPGIVFGLGGAFGGVWAATDDV
jgi:hypothetical protein